MNRYFIQDKSNQWTEKVRLNQSEVKNGELTMIGWKSNRIVIPIQAGEGAKNENQEIRQLDH